MHSFGRVDVHNRQHRHSIPVWQIVRSCVVDGARVCAVFVLAGGVHCGGSVWCAATVAAAVVLRVLLMSHCCRQETIFGDSVRVCLV